MLEQGALEGQSKGRAAHKCQEMFRHRDGVRVEVETCEFSRGQFADAKTASLCGLGPARGLGLACTWCVFLDQTRSPETCICWPPLTSGMVRNRYTRSLNSEISTDFPFAFA